MRVGKKPTIVEAKKTRSCVVRLETMPAKSTRSSPASAAGSRGVNTLQDEKTLRGPLKKRPISAQEATTPGISKAKEKFKLLQKAVRNSAQAAASMTRASSPSSTSSRAVETPTIAAGRSRRAIKPNPKYTSEDMVTPKSIKHVGGESKRRSSGEKREKRFGSSSEDFYSRESSEGEGFDEEADEILDESFQLKNKVKDSDFSAVEEETTTAPPPRKRGRPRKNKPPDDSTNATAPTTSSARAESKNEGLTVRSTPSQLQQLRRTLTASVNRVSAIERKRNVASEKESGSEDEGISFMVKRARKFNSKLSAKASEGGGSDDEPMSNTVSVRRSLPVQTMNGNKILQSSPRVEESGNKAKIKIEARIESDKSSSAATKTTTSSKPTANLRQQRSSPASPIIVARPNKKDSATVSTSTTTEDKPEKLSSSIDEDFEGTPTFTIVNINDIINKKGDVLISKSVPKASTGFNRLQKSSTAAASIITEISSSSSSSPLPTEKVDVNRNRRKTVHTNLLSDKSPEPLKAQPSRVSLPTTTSAKKLPVQKTIINHALANKAAAAAAAAAAKAPKASAALRSSPSPEKPAPRILNSMVAKKTLPVKPLISNIDDSGDESLTLSMDDDVNETESDIEEGASPLLKSESCEDSPKENSSAAGNNLSPTTTTNNNNLQRKLSPEKVTITRQGDKIIKKITCFENWYVLNIPETETKPPMRNVLEMPLVDLANVAKSVKLPSEKWSTKVTLYELSSTMLSKSSYSLYTGDLKEHNIAEDNRSKYQPSCVMFRRQVKDREKSRLPFDRAVIFKNKSFFTNIEGKNIRLVGAPTTISTQEEVEVLLEIIDSLTLKSNIVEPAAAIQ